MLFRGFGISIVSEKNVQLMWRIWRLSPGNCCSPFSGSVNEWNVAFYMAIDWECVVTSFRFRASMLGNDFDKLRGWGWDKRHKQRWRVLRSMTVKSIRKKEQCTQTYLQYNLDQAMSSSIANVGAQSRIDRHLHNGKIRFSLCRSWIKEFSSKRKRNTDLRFIIADGRPSLSRWTFDWFTERRQIVVVHCRGE